MLQVPEVSAEKEKSQFLTDEPSLFMRLEITVISSIRLHAEGFHSRYSALVNGFADLHGVKMEAEINF